MSYGQHETLSEAVEFHTKEMLDWAEGRRSWTNQFHLHPDLVAIMDAGEVAKHAAALMGLCALVVR